jgi:DNA-binding IclR family transcriptional regulator
VGAVSSGGRVLVTVELEKLAETLARLYKGYLTVEQLARHLGTNTRSAGRVAAKLERMGLLQRHSRRTYMIRVQRHPRPKLLERRGL